MAGGAWKVAYADFVTALMALFMVLWIVSQDEEIVVKTVEYFKDPFGVGFQDAQKGSLNDNTETSGQSITQEEQEEQKTAVVDLAMLHKLANEYYEKLNVQDQLERSDKKPIKVDVIPEGIRITIFDENKQRIFEKDSDQFTKWGRYVVQNVSWVVDQNDLKINIDCHTPRGPSREMKGFRGPWELTTARSNAARRLLEEFSISSVRIHRVSGYADTEPLPNVDPGIPSNERLEISLVVM